MRTEFIYSLAALTAFPVMGYAQNRAQQAKTHDAITTNETGGEAVSKNVTLKPGVYKFKSLAASEYASPSDKDSNSELTVELRSGSATGSILVSGEFAVGKDFELEFTLPEPAEVYAVYTSSNKKIKLGKGAEWELQFNFSGIATELQKEYNKLTVAMNAYNYEGKDKDFNTYSAYYERISNIASADYAYYEKNDEGLQALYANQSDVTDLQLYKDIQNARKAAKEKQAAYLGPNGDGLLKALNDRYDALTEMYQNAELTDLKNAAAKAYNAYVATDMDDTLDALNALIDAKDKYAAGLDTQENAKTANENAKTNLLEQLNAVKVTYYEQAKETVGKNYDGDRYSQLKTELLAELQTVVAGESVTAAIQTAYEALKVADESVQTELTGKIAQLKQDINKVVAEYNGYKTKVENAYAKYDKEKDDADKVTKSAEGVDFLQTYKGQVDNALNSLKEYIEKRDTKNKVDNLSVADISDDEIANLITAIQNSVDTYKAKSVIYNDYTTMMGEVNALETSLNTAKTNIDKYAADKKLAPSVYLPTTIWESTIEGIGIDVSNLRNKVGDYLVQEETTTYKESDEYKNEKAAITKGIDDLKKYANEATDIYATIQGRIDAEKALQTAISDQSVAPKIDFTALNVWTNQVTTDDVIKARTPYKTVTEKAAETTEEWVAKLTTARTKKQSYDPDKDDNTGNILGYLKSIAETPADVLKDEIETLTAITQNYETDEEAFTAQMDAQEIAGLQGMIVSKIASLQPRVDALQARISATVDNEFGNKKSALLQAEVDKINETIAAAQAVVDKKEKATKAEAQAQYSAISKALSESILTVESLADDYKAEFAVFTERYNQLNGSESDAETLSTVNALKNKVKSAKETIDGYEHLTDAQKTTYKNNVEGVSVQKTENSKKVTYKISNILEFIENSKMDEELTEENVTKYQGIINDLKTAINTPLAQANWMNGLEDQLKTAADKMTQAKDAILAKDPNEQGFFYLKLIGTGAGQYQKQYNDLKNKIEKETKLTSSKVNSYTSQITALTTAVNSLAAKAEANLAWKTAQTDYLAATKNHVKTDAEPFYGLDQAIAELNQDKYSSTKQSEQLTTLRGYYDKITAQESAVTNVYDNGTYDEAEGGVKVAGENATVRNEINELLEQYTNEVNYNAQVAADNQAIYDNITAAHNDAIKAYKDASAVINAYNNLQSDELKGATDQAKTELDELMEVLYNFDGNANDIQGRADAAFGSTVSPSHFDTEEKYKGEFEALTADINSKTNALKQVIMNFSIGNVKTSIAEYTEAIAATKTKVADFTSEEGKTWTEDEINANTYIKNANDLLKDITDNFNEETLSDDVKALDEALLAAETETTWDGESWKKLNYQAARAEYNMAQTALQFFTTGDIYTFFNENLTGSDKTSYKKYRNIIHNSRFYSETKTYRYLVDNFADIKAKLLELYQKAEKNKADKDLVSGAQTAIAAANMALTTAQNMMYQYAAGASVKPTLDKIAQELAQYPESGVTPANAEEWEQKAKDIKENILAVANDGYDAEVALIKDLISTAKKEQVTYAANNNDGAAKKTIIDTQVDNLAAIEAAVAPETGEPTKTKLEALQELIGIEQALNNVINEMQTANGTNKNQAIISELRTNLEEANAANTLSGYTETTVGGAENWAKLNADQDAITDAINSLRDYLANHQNDIAAYQANAEAQLADINAAIVAMKEKAAQMKRDYEDGVEQQAQQALADTWQQAEDAITAAQDQFNNLNEELKAYGSASKYANKVNQLNKQIADAELILAQAQTDADAETTTAKKQEFATKAVADVNEALTNFEANCEEIIGRAKESYITAAITAMEEEIEAITWNSDNYTTKDGEVLTAKKEAISNAIPGYKTAAEAQEHANAYKVGNTDYDGVIKTLADKKAEFDAAVKELKQMMKDYSLEAEVKGHITGGETIEIEDIYALTTIIANAQEGTAEMERCDVNGDNRITVTDIIWLQYFWAFNEWPDGTTNAPAFDDYAGSSNAVSIETVSAANNVTRVAVKLNNRSNFRAFQIGMQLPVGAKVVGQSFGERVVDGYLMHSEATEDFVRFMTISSIDKPFAGNEGVVLYVDIENLNGQVALTEAYFTDTQFNEDDLLMGDSQTTGIKDKIVNALENVGQKVYDLGGKLMNGVKKGFNIIRNADGTTKKVINK